jgi:hypothetical protein
MADGLTDENQHLIVVSWYNYSTAGATLNTERIDQLTGLKGTI